MAREVRNDIRVLVDDVLIGDYQENNETGYIETPVYQQLIADITGLATGEHTCTIKKWDASSEAYANFDYALALGLHADFYVEARTVHQAKVSWTLSDQNVIISKLYIDGVDATTDLGGPWTGSRVSTSPPHYRSGVLPFYTAADKMRVSRGAIEIDGTLYEEAADTAELDTDDAGSYVSGSSEKGASKWLYVYVKGDDDGGWTAKFSDDPPLFPTCSKELVFTAQVSAEPASGATSISYDGDAGDDRPGRPGRREDMDGLRPHDGARGLAAALRGHRHEHADRRGQQRGRRRRRKRPCCFAGAFSLSCSASWFSYGRNETLLAKEKVATPKGALPLSRL